MSVIAPFLVANVKGCLGIEGKIERWVGLPVMAAILTLSTPLFVTTPVSLAEMVDVPRASSLFQKACIGCHVGGGNILQPLPTKTSLTGNLEWFDFCDQGATLLMKDLERNGAASEDELYNITYYGKGRMPGFGEKCTPRGQCTFGPRLQDEDIATLAKFVRLQAEKGWPNIEY